MLGVERYEVKLVPHDEKWEEEAERVSKELKAVLGENVIYIYHIGSTSIKGILAKPILDLAVEVKSLEQLNKEGMGALGYEDCGESGVDGRYLFVKRRDGHISIHHIHCYEKGNKALIQVIKFRDFLNAHAEYAQQYCELKKELAERFPKDRNSYTAGKENFIKRICELADKQHSF